MNPFSKKLSLVLLGTALVFAGCTKKPRRPSPNDTVLGTGAGAVNPTDTSFGQGSITDGSPDLTPRTAADADGGMRGILPTVYFDFDSPVIKAAERVKLQEAQRYLNEHPEHRLKLEGHCDWRGTAEYNLGLGDRRGNAVKQYLVTLGVSAAKLEVQSKGDLDAVEKGAEDQMSKDRKVELVVMPK